MRECANCGKDCDASIGMARELVTNYWGGRRNGNVEYSPKVVTFFCDEACRNFFIEDGGAGGEVQTERWDRNGEDSDEISVSDLN